MISVVIPAYKNTGQLVANLRQNLPFLAECEIILVNDDPATDLAGKLPGGDITLIQNPRNLGFAGAVDTGIKAANNRYIMLLNSDVLLKDASYRKALSQIRGDDRIFAVSFAQEEKGGSVVGKNTIFWQNGFFSHAKAGDLKAGINGWAEGGACLIDKKKYEVIGGFDRLYSPYYWEDIDLSYRAWKQGFQILFNPEILVEHHHESTIGKYFTSKRVKTIAYRNQFTFIWKNIRDRGLLNSHIIATLKMLPAMALKDSAFVSGFLKALVRLPRIITEKNKAKPDTISDRGLLQLFSNHL